MLNGGYDPNEAGKNEDHSNDGIYGFYAFVGTAVLAVAALAFGLVRHFV